MFAIKFADLAHAVVNLPDGDGVIVRAQSLGGLGAGVDHEQLWLELEQRPGEFRRLGVLLNEREDIEIAFGIANDRGEILQLQQANVTVMVLQRLKLQARAILRLQRKTRVTAIV